jgi:hypothetical protein
MDGERLTNVLKFRVELDTENRLLLVGDAGILRVCGGTNNRKVLGLSITID